MIHSCPPGYLSRHRSGTGRARYWWPYGTGGQPVSFELLNPAFLLFLVVKDNALAYYLVGLFKLVIAGFGGYLLLRIFLRWLPSMWGGIVFMLCGFNAAWFFWDQVATAMWIPWLLCCNGHVSQDRRHEMAACDHRYFTSAYIRGVPQRCCVRFLRLCTARSSSGIYGILQEAIGTWLLKIPKN